MKVTQLYLTLCNPMDCSPPVLCLWHSPIKNTGVGSLSLLQGILPPQGLNPSFPNCRKILYCLLLLLLLSPFSRVWLCDPIDSTPPGSPVPGILQNTGVGCHFLLQCMKVKSESEVAQSCPTPSHSKDCSLPGSSILGVFQARVLEWVAIAFSALLSEPPANQKQEHTKSQALSRLNVHDPV